MPKIINTERLPIKLWLDDIDPTTLKQAKDLANLPHTYKWIAIMPDAHPGYGMPIGGVVATTDIIIPNAVGVDIGCGIRAVKTNIKNIDRTILTQILEKVRKRIPTGFAHHKIKQKWDGFSRAPNIEIIQKELDNAKYQIGTLGGGNHFIEILKDKNSNIWLMIHSGSRNFGYKTAEFFHHKASKFCQEKGIKLPTQELSFLSIEKDEGKKYFTAMSYCLEFAKANREKMMETLKSIVNEETGCDFIEEIDVHHNYASLEKHFGKEVFIHRKGAINAEEGKAGIIPGSMGTPSYITEGLGNPESFKSSSHGAGRRLGRREAIRKLNLKQEQEKMKEIIGKPRIQKELEEAPGAYKDIEAVMEKQKDLVKVKEKLIPLAVITGI